MTAITSKEALAKALRDIASEIATSEEFQVGTIDVSFHHYDIEDPPGSGVSASKPTGWITIDWSATFKPGKRTKIT